MQSMDFKQLLDDYRNGKMNAEERAAFEQLLHSMESEPQLHQLLNDSLGSISPVHAEETQEYLYEQIKERFIQEALPRKRDQRVRVLNTAWFRYAAAIIIVFGVAAYFWLNNKKQEKSLTNNNKQIQTDIAPGHDGAILTLADGRHLVLDSLKNGVIAMQNGSQVELKNGSVHYNTNEHTTGGIIYNTMRTPRGRQFQLVLPDGTKVWLNAASSIKYPTVFTGATRTVEIEGEAYFEVKPLHLPTGRDGGRGKKIPFIVNILRGATIEVLGTHFNVNAYEDEASIKTTLLEGSVNVKSDVGSRKSDQSSAILKPGQQAVIAMHSPLTIDHSPPLTINHAPDLIQVMAWKNGLFNFNGYDIKAVMREIGRWYDLDVVYEGEPEPEEMMGELQRNLTLSQVMKILQKIHIKYRIEGRKLIVMNRPSR
ncbi:MAG TPA: FecR domain-containing protein [Niastella sp.]